MFKNFIDYFLLIVKQFPEKTAIITHNKVMTYKELDEQSNYLQNLLLANHVTSEEIIPLLFERCADMIVAMLGVLKSGCAFLPISNFTPCQRRKFILEDSQARFVITNNSQLLNHLPSHIKMISLQQPEMTSKAKDFTPYPLTQFTPNQLAYVMYTSGSTGNPKGVLIEHGSMMNLFLSLVSELNLTEQDTVLALTDYTFDISLIELILPLMLGATIVLTEQGTIGNGLKIKTYLNQYQITLMQATPITWEILLKQGWINDGTMKLLVGGEKFTSRLANSLEYGKGNIWNMYGPTETTMWSLSYHLEEPIHTETVPLGKPLANTTVAILDNELNECAVGQQGELYIGGLGLARGYLNNFELTQQKFICHPKTGERLYKTGDLVIAHDESTLCFIDRCDEQLKLGGIRIEAGEIEHLIEKMPFVKKAVVKLHEKEDYYKFLAAYVEIDEAKAFQNSQWVKEHEVSHYLKTTYDEVYREAADYGHEEINACGWQSSFTGQLLSSEELKESYQFINKVISESDLSAVLEVGCGTGSLLLQHIDKAKHYTAIELSSQAISYVKEKLTKEQSEKTLFKTQAAIDIHEKQRYSCIIVNSVIQYFPSINYLVTVLKQLIAAAKPNSTLIIGDVRSLELLDIFLLEKMSQKNNTHTELSLDSIYYKSREAEIILSPYFFYALKEMIPDISHVDIAVKHGVYKNELNYFRYDVILHINKSINYSDPLTIHFNSEFEQKTLLKALKENKDKVIIVEKIPNLFINHLLINLHEKFPNSMRSLALNGSIIPSNVQAAVDSLLNFESDTHEKWIIYDKEDALNGLEIYFYPINKQTKLRVKCPKVEPLLYSYCREPFNLLLQKSCFDHIRSEINQHLISWITPSTYIWMEKWPLTINGKLDKKQLQPLFEDNTIEHADSTLGKLQHIWQNITGSAALVDKKFSDQGISSLYTHFFLATVNETFKTQVGYKEIHQYNTLIKLADHINKQALIQSSSSAIV